MARAALRAGLAAISLGLAGCATVNSPPPSDNAYCAWLFDRLDAIDFGPQPAVIGFDFRQSLIASIQQNKCLTFTRNLTELEAVGARLAPHTPPAGPALRAPVAVQAGVVTNIGDEGRARAFFEGLGYRARTQGSSRLGTRVFVEARTLGQIEDIVAIAGQAGFVGAFPSRFAAY